MMREENLSADKKQQSDYDKLMKFAKLVRAMRRQQASLENHSTSGNPKKLEIVRNATKEYEKAVDYMTDRILN